VVSCRYMSRDEETSDTRDSCAVHITAGYRRNWTHHFVRMKDRRIHKLTYEDVASRGPV
jgi:hypothetical protein